MDKLVDPRGDRHGHAEATALEEVRASELDPRLSLSMYELIAAASFEYIDRISQRAVVIYQDERDRWLGNRNTMRALRVRDLIAGGDVDINAVIAAIRYPLRRIHVALEP